MGNGRFGSSIRSALRSEFRRANEDPGSGRSVQRDRPEREKSQLLFSGGHMRQRVGIIGLVHDHVWGLLKQWESLADVEIVAVAEPNAGLFAKVALPRSTPRFYHSWEELLQKETLDLVQITNENNAARAVVEAAAARK